jgi:hypothetical protein
MKVGLLLTALIGLAGCATESNSIVGEWTRKTGDSTEQIRFTPQGQFERRTHFPSFTLITTGDYSIIGKRLNIAIKTARPEDANDSKMNFGAMIGQRQSGDLEVKGDSEFSYNNGKETLVFERKP